MALYDFMALCTLQMQVTNSFLIFAMTSLRMQDNDLEREYQVHRTDSDYALAEFWKWAISCLIGLSMGCIGFGVDWGINLLNDAKYQSTANVLRTHGKACCIRSYIAVFVPCVHTLKL